MRRRFQRRIAPDAAIVAVLKLRGFKGPNIGNKESILARYVQRYGLTNTLGSQRLLGDQWLTENRFLLFSKRSGGLFARIGALEHALGRTEVELQWADFTEATLQKRLIHLTTSDHRMNISKTVVNSDEADLFVRAVADRGREIGLQEL